jgi:hypothetical protein
MKHRSSFLKAFDVLGIVLAASVVLAWMYGLQVRNWYRARELKKTRPAVSLVPRPLADTRVANGKGITLAAFGYQMDAPWSDLQGHQDTSAVAVFLFTGGVGLRFWNPATTSGAVALMREAVEQAKRNFSGFLGARTEYEFLNAELNATPKQFSPFMNKNEAFREGLLLNMKWLEVAREPSAMYSLALNGLRGFQLGDPSIDRIVEIRSFDDDEREFRFLFAVERGSNVKIEQGEINKVIQSLRPVAASDPADSFRR